MTTMETERGRKSSPGDEFSDVGTLDERLRSAGFAIHVIEPGRHRRAQCQHAGSAMRSFTLWNTPRRMALSVRSRNHRSTRLSHEEDVGVKWR